ncbi:MAG: DUF885 family protein [Pseudohaliea sp.]
MPSARHGRAPAGVLGLVFSCLLALPAARAAPAGDVVYIRSPEALLAHYQAAWVAFYPSEAYAFGDEASAARFEDYAPTRVEPWLAKNREVARAAAGVLASGVDDDALRLDLTVLQRAAEDELARWREDEPLTAQPQWYAEQASQALTYLLVRAAPGRARSDATVARLRGVAELAERGRGSLVRGNRQRTQTALGTLRATRAFYEGDLLALTADWPAARDGTTVAAAAGVAAAALAALETHLEERILPAASESPALGSDVYEAKLGRRTGGLYTAERLRSVAREEVRTARALMDVEARRWRASLPAGEAAGIDDGAVLTAALAAMEADRDDSGADLLVTFRRLTAAAERFVVDRAIATVPQPTTLVIDLSPAHFSGAAVGGVYPSGPFAPDAPTLFYVPSIPGDAPEQARNGFYRSFNTHFNTMIISHEMFPGHYLQYKVAVQAAPRVRTLFPNGSYLEGWGSFAEELMLDAGWADNAPLTRLAHLRKRLENATRAYVSVQVNTAGWGREDVLTFAREEGLLAPQFALNLWQRVVNSPLQITDYMTGYLAFRELFAAYRAAAPDAPLRPWVDAVLRAGPLPLSLLPAALPAAEVTP